MKYYSKKGLDSEIRKIVGSEGTDLQAVWDSLMGNSDDFANDKINVYHLALGSGLSVDVSTNPYTIRVTADTFHPYQGNTATKMVASYFSLGGTYSSSESKLVWDSDHSAWHLIGNFYADGWISAGGVSPGGGASGTTLAAVWQSLMGNSDDYANDKIDAHHIPIGSGLSIDGSGNIYVTSQGSVTSIVVNGNTYTPTSGVITLPDYPTSMAWSAITSTPTTLGGYGITDANINNGVITLGSNTITPLVSHQTIYMLTLQVGGTQVGTFTANSAAATINITASNITSAIGSTTYHPYQGNTSTKMVASYFSLGQNYTPSGGSATESKIVWDSTYSAWHLIGNFYADGWISAGGVSTGGGTSGIDLQAMWNSLQNNDIGDYAYNLKINTGHIPDLSSTYLPLSGGTIDNGGANNLNINSSGASGNNYMYFKVGGTNKASTGYYNGLAFVANEATFARIGVNDSGVPQYWSYGSPDTAQTLYHTGNLSPITTTNWTSSWRSRSNHWAACPPESRSSSDGATTRAAATTWN